MRTTVTLDPEPPERYVVEPHAGGFVSGIDPDKLNQLVDELQVGDFVTEANSSP